jgi:hypothetical protein
VGVGCGDGEGVTVGVGVGVGVALAVGVGVGVGVGVVGIPPAMNVAVTTAEEYPLGPTMWNLNALPAVLPEK